MDDCIKADHPTGTHYPYLFRLCCVYYSRVQHSQQPPAQARLVKHTVEIDKALLERARAFDEQALGQIYDAYFERLCRYAYRWVDDAEAAQDIAAEALLRWLNALGHGRAPDNLGAWLYSVAHNLAMDAYRKHPPGRTVRLEPELIQLQGPDVQADVEQQLARAQVRRAMARLTPEQQKVVVLKFLEGYSNSEVSALMDKPVGAIKSLQHRALAALRRVLR